MEKMEKISDDESSDDAGWEKVEVEESSAEEDTKATE
jgi:hypothetical protein